MKGNILNGIWKVVVVVLLIAFLKPIFNWVSDYYFKRPTIVILAFVGIIILIYIIVFFKEIFLKHKSDRNPH